MPGSSGANTRLRALASARRGRLASHARADPPLRGGRPAGAHIPPR